MEMIIAVALFALACMIILPIMSRSQRQLEQQNVSNAALGHAISLSEQLKSTLDSDEYNQTIQSYTGHEWNGMEQSIMIYLDQDMQRVAMAESAIVLEIIIQQDTPYGAGQMVVTRMIYRMATDDEPLLELETKKYYPQASVEVGS